jgi:hypothetical protein
MSGIFIKWNLRDGGGETRGGWFAAVASHFRRLLRGRNDVYCGEPLKGISFKKWTVGLFDWMGSSFGTCAKKLSREQLCSDMWLHKKCSKISSSLLLYYVTCRFSSLFCYNFSFITEKINLNEFKNILFKTGSSIFQHSTIEIFQF